MTLNNAVQFRRLIRHFVADDAGQWPIEVDPIVGE
jgi:hypothetical protein